MSKRFLTVSDLSGNPINNDDDVVTVVVWDHPLIEQPVQLDAGKAEVANIDGSGQDYAVIELISDGGDKSERMVLELSAFDKLFTLEPDDVLSNAEKYSYGKPQPSAQVAESPRRGRPSGSGSRGAAPTTDKIDYSLVEHAGQPHRGKVSPQEAETVRMNLDEVNRRRVANGHGPIDPADEKMATRYGFSEMKPEDRPKLAPEFKS